MAVMSLVRGTVVAALVCVASYAAIAQSPPGTAGTVEVAQNDALQAAINARNIGAIFAIVNAIPRDQRGPVAARLLAAAQALRNRDKQFAASLAAMAFLSGGLNPAQQNLAMLIVRDSPGGAAVVANLLADNATSCVACFGFSLDGQAFSTFVAGENPNSRGSQN